MPSILMTDECHPHSPGVTHREALAPHNPHPPVRWQLVLHIVGAGLPYPGLAPLHHRRKGVVNDVEPMVDAAVDAW